ncbi:MAG: hypothetical protein ACI92G_001669 [Candidatus Pelagisphaera sp.]|jgi:hypothetical protein
MTITDVSILGAVAVTAAWLLSPQVRKSKNWRATVTPLASIIGSGFLVAAPLVAVIVGKAAPLAMLGIVLLAYGIGGIIRFNIRNLEPLLAGDVPPPRSIWLVEKASGIVLSVAYIVSVAFYLRLLSSFVLHGAGQNAGLYVNLLTSAILLFIGLTGYIRGLHALERLEVYSVTIKLTIIAALILGLGMFDLSSFGDIFTHDIAVKDHNAFQQLRLLAGLLLIVQGFETSRYLGAEYDADTRINTMRQAQFVSGVIYVIFVLLALPLLTHMKGTNPDETAIIDLARLVSPILPAMLIIAAVMSQFSAAIADTLGGGGLIAQSIGKKLDSRRSYLVITFSAIALVWFANIFQIISIASRAFAFYYLLQGINAWLAAGKCLCGWRCCLQRTRFGALILILAFVVIFGLAAE